LISPKKGKDHTNLLNFFHYLTPSDCLCVNRVQIEENLMKYLKFCIGVIFTGVVSISLANTPPEPREDNLTVEATIEIGGNAHMDLSVIVSDPDGDDLDYFLHPWSEPLPEGLSLDNETGIISGTLLSVQLLGSSEFYYYAQDPSGEQTAIQIGLIWVPFANGPITSLFFRECRPEYFDCIPGYGYKFPGQMLGYVGSEATEGSSSMAQFPDPPETTRGAASVGYEGDELTPAISAYMRPANERFTGQHTGLARHTLSSDLTINAELTYSQSGGIRVPTGEPLPEELPFGAMARAELFAFTLAPEANGKINAGLCNWNVEGAGGRGVGARRILLCILAGGHPHILNLQVVSFPLPEVGSSAPLNGVVTAAVSNGSTFASLSLVRDLVAPEGAENDPAVFIGLSMYQLARYGGEVDSRNTLRITYVTPDALEPAMPEVTEPSFEPAPALGEISINDGNCINLNGHGKIPVVIHGRDYMPAEDIDVTTIEFGGLEIASRGSSKNSRPACSIEDIDLDTINDLTCHFVDDTDELEGVDGGLIEITWDVNINGVPEGFSATGPVCFE
jgi:hypothetical protein